ncbi:MAG: malectin domain-containing carbohydrate-binding protein, partial [Bryobacteraceae bacterium]
MEALTPSREEQAEVTAILQSGIFHRAPNLEHFFRYICERYFEGQGGQIKEYSVAVEALGRPAAFDPRKDSIVRVEAHRLRKRLHEYYEGPGSGHAVQILIPNGQYVPQFVTREVVKATEEPPIVEYIPPPEAPKPAVSQRWSRRREIFLGAGALAVTVAALLFGNGKLNTRAISANEKWTGPAAGPAPTEFRMLAGYHGAPFTDRQGHAWYPESYFNGGRSSAIPADRFIEGEPDPHLLRSQRSGEFGYDIPLRQGTYELHLYFAETEYGGGNPRGGGDGNRIFRVSVNGATSIDYLDPLAEAGGPNRFHGRVFKDISPASDGRLHLKFQPLNGPAFLNAIEILPSMPGRIRPVRIVMQSSPVTDAEGHIWSADEFFVGGSPAFRPKSVFNVERRVLYQGERYGNFSYHIPLAPGKYRLTLHFAETWFGTPESHEPLFGRRLFDVFANRLPLLRNFEVAREAGGGYRGIQESFENL